MMPKSIPVQISMTETTHFRRLVDFLIEVERHADEECDIALQGLVEVCRNDLVAICGEGQHDDE